MELVITLYAIGQILSSLSTVVTASNFNGILSKAKLGLYSNNITVNDQTKLSDLTEATFTGYGQGSATPWSTSLVAGDGSEYQVSPAVVFAASGTPTPEVIYGLFISDGNATPALVAAGAFPTPISINVAGDGVAVAAKAVVGPALSMSAEIL